jgi:hypothetical protein
MYFILDELSEYSKEDNVINFLTDANPFMREGETSVDEVIYDDFKKKFALCQNNDDYYFNFICSYLMNIDPYYGDIYSIFKQLTKDEYVDTCINIINNHPEQLKNI